MFINTGAWDCSYDWQKLVLNQQVFLFSTKYAKIKSVTSNIRPSFLCSRCWISSFACLHLIHKTIQMRNSADLPSFVLDWLFLTWSWFLALELSIIVEHIFRHLVIYHLQLIKTTSQYLMISQ